MKCLSMMKTGLYPHPTNFFNRDFRQNAIKINIVFRALVTIQNCYTLDVMFLGKRRDLNTKMFFKFISEVENISIHFVAQFQETSYFIRNILTFKKKFLI